MDIWTTSGPSLDRKKQFKGKRHSELQGPQMLLTCGLKIVLHFPLDISLLLLYHGPKPLSDLEVGDFDLIEGNQTHALERGGG